MRRSTLLIFGLLLSHSFAEELPPVAPMPQYATLPARINSAVFPTGKFDWFELTKAQIETGKKNAATCQIIFDGDSYMVGWHAAANLVWKQHYAEFNAVNFGIDGDTTAQILWRLLQGQGEGMHPKLIDLMVGSNSIKRNSSAEIAEGVKAVLDAYQKRFPAAVILLQGILPRNDKPDNPFRIQIKEVNELLSKLGDGKKVIFIDFGDKFLQPDGTINRDLMPNLLLPNVKGYQVWADAIQPIVDSVFQGRQ